MYKKFAALVNVPLFLVSAEYDVCLDDSVMMAKKWNGPVCLDVCENLPHGFLNFIMFSEEAKQSSDLCVTRIKQAMEIYIEPPPPSVEPASLEYVGRAHSSLEPPSLETLSLEPPS